MKLIGIKFIFLLLITMPTPSVARIDCEQIKNTIKHYSEPSKDALREAAALYDISPSSAKCLYPDVVVEKQPLGEYEEYDKAGPSKLTLLGRTKYIWGDFIYYAAVLYVPNGMTLNVSPVSKGKAYIDGWSLEVTNRRR